jgi:hypothetical protein
MAATNSRIGMRDLVTRLLRFVEEGPLVTDAARRVVWVSVGLLYAGLVAVGVWRHEPWFDEAQAWLLARDLRQSELFFHALRYEGTPGLWHALLLVPTRMHLPYVALNVTGGLFAVAGVLVFLRHAPLPWLLRVLVPFTFFVLYQYAVVARSYCLLPLLVFLVAWRYPRRFEQPWRLVLLLALLANISLHGVLIAGGVWAAHLLDVFRRWKQMGFPARVTHAAASLSLLVVAALIALQIYPPADSTSATHLWSEPADIARRAFSAWDESMTGIWWLSSLIVIASAIWFFNRRALALYLVPTLMLLALFGFRYVSPWHQGALFIVWIMALWLSFTEPERIVLPPLARLGLIAAFVVPLVLHVNWAVRTWRLDYKGSYSGTRDAAAYIRAHGLDRKRIFGLGYPSFGVQPYFDRNIFINLNHGKGPAFWPWSRDADNVQDPEACATLRPDYVLIDLKTNRGEQPAGYHLIRISRGRLWWKGWEAVDDSYELFGRDEDEKDATVSP